MQERLRNLPLPVVIGAGVAVLLVLFMAVYFLFMTGPKYVDLNKSSSDPQVIQAWTWKLDQDGIKHREAKDKSGKIKIQVLEQDETKANAGLGMPEKMGAKAETKCTPPGALAVSDQRKKFTMC